MSFRISKASSHQRSRTSEPPQVSGRALPGLARWAPEALHRKTEVRNRGTNPLCLLESVKALCAHAWRIRAVPRTQPYPALSRLSRLYREKMKCQSRGMNPLCLLESAKPLCAHAWRVRAVPRTQPYPALARLSRLYREKMKCQSRGMNPLCLLESAKLLRANARHVRAAPRCPAGPGAFHDGTARLEVVFLVGTKPACPDLRSSGWHGRETATTSWRTATKTFRTSKFDGRHRAGFGG